MEQAATESEEALERYLAEVRWTPGPFAAWWGAEVFPCVFGAALRMEGVEALLSALVDYSPRPVYLKRRRRESIRSAATPRGTAYWLKVTGGSLRVRQSVSGRRENGEPWERKSTKSASTPGTGSRRVEEVGAGAVCAVTGLTVPRTGEGLGRKKPPGPAY
jgi:translation elongation factor EF-G